MPTRRHFLATLAIATLAPSARAAESATLDILVDKGAWGTSSLEDIRTVAASAAETLWKHCPGQRLRPIRVYHRADFPFTDFGHDWRGRIRIGLATEDRRWGQLAFQFAHEFCHALAQHSFAAKRSWHPPRHSNLWFEESLCETASLFALRQMGREWRTQPPQPRWRDAASEFSEFVAARLARPDHQLPAGVSFAEWLRDNQSELRANAALRARNVIVARQMLPLFEAEPAGWGAVPYLNLGKRQKDKPLAQYLAEWLAASPAELRPFVARVAALFRPAR